MSVNYHAFQSRGVPFSEYETICQQWREEFTGYDTSRIVRILHLKTDGQWLYVSYYGTPYRLDLKDGHLEKKAGEEWSGELYFNESMAIYHLLHYTKDVPLTTGKWVPNYALDGVVSRSPTKDPLLSPFANRFAGRLHELESACEKAGGRKQRQGDLCYEFDSFPFLKLRLVFWDADEDFPAQLQVLVDSHVTDFVHYETVGCIISDLLERLEA